MWSAFIIFITYLFAVYGLICLIMTLAQGGLPVKRKKRLAKLVLMVKDQEESVEGIIKNIACGELLKKAMTDSELVVLDAGSTDRTMEILRKLEKDFEFVYVIGDNEKEKIFNIFSQDMG